MAAGLSAAVSLFLGILVAIFTGYWFVILVFITVGTLLLTFIASKVMMRVKRGKPPGYYKVKKAVILAKFGISNQRLIVKSRVWDIGR